MRGNHQRDDRPGNRVISGGKSKFREPYKMTRMRKTVLRRTRPDASRNVAMKKPTRSKRNKAGGGGKPRSHAEHAESQTADVNDAVSEASDDRSAEALRAEEIRGAGHRETVEAFVVAFILALLFRAFIAEAFVIPTGSMAPTLMGAHKDLVCDRCTRQFQVGASLERRGPVTENVVVAGTCPNCRHVNLLDLATDAGASTFNGDRILVSKFAYTLRDPERWDVIVFKFPGNPKQNYIKRLVGLPNEILTIRSGDVYARPVDAESPRDAILRKSPRKLLAMRHLVYDTAFQSPGLVESEYPARWQPWQPGAERPPADSWTVDRSGGVLTAVVEAGDAAAPKWLRYFHHWPDDGQWDKIDAGLSQAGVDPYQSRLITDFYAYDAAISVAATKVYDRPPSKAPGSGLSRLRNLLGSGYGGGQFSPDYEPGGDLDQFIRVNYGTPNTARDGLHWVGDLMVEADVETSPESQELLLELIEAGVKYQCGFDLSDGTAVLSINDGTPQPFVGPGGETSVSPAAVTDVVAGSRHTMRLSNCDDQLLLWVDGSLVEFDAATTFDSRSYRGAAANHAALRRPTSSAGRFPGRHRGDRGDEHDSPPPHRPRQVLHLDRRPGTRLDYDMSTLWELTGQRVTLSDIQAVMTEPELWSQFKGWNARRSVSFKLEEDQFFPMGDNSPESLDARCWAGAKEAFGMDRSVDDDAYRWSDAWYVPRDLLVGKALLVFWPHPWNEPLPYTPNFNDETDSVTRAPRPRP